MPRNFSILNSLGGNRNRARGDCREAVDTADYVSHRDGSGESLYPDSVVMTKRLFGSYLTNVANFPGTPPPNARFTLVLCFPLNSYKKFASCVLTEKLIPLSNLTFKFVCLNNLIF